MAIKFFSNDRHDVKQKFKLTTRKLSGRFFGDRHQKLDSEYEQSRQEYIEHEKTTKFFDKMTSPLIPVDFDETDWGSRFFPVYRRLSLDEKKNAQVISSIDICFAAGSEIGIPIGPVISVSKFGIPPEPKKAKNRTGNGICFKFWFRTLLFIAFSHELYILPWTLLRNKKNQL